MCRVQMIILALAICHVNSAYSSEPIVVRELVTYLYADGEMKEEKSNKIIKYTFDEDVVTRTEVMDIENNRVIPDSTPYYIQHRLTNDFQPNYAIRAVGLPGLDSIEVLAITDDYILSTRSTSNYFVISRQQVLEKYP